MTDIKKIIFLADFFIEDTLGGAELHDNVVLNHFKSLNLLDSKIRCQQLNRDIILANRDKVWFIGNFATLSNHHKALLANTSGDQNTAVGANAADSVTTASHIVAIGYCSMQTNTTGSNNVAVGNYSQFLETTGQKNVSVGYESNRNLTDGEKNTSIGHLSGYTTTTGDNNANLGNEAQASSATASNQVTLGNSSISSIRSQVQSISALSDRRDKKNIKDLEIGLNFIDDLKPVTFDWNRRDGSKPGKKEVGFIAQDLDETQIKYNLEEHLEIVLKDNPDKLEAAPGKILPILVKAIQELSVQNKELKAEIDELKKK